MNIEQWLRALIEHFAPTGQRPETTRKLVEVLGSKLHDVPVGHFTDASLRALQGNLRSVSSPVRVRDALLACVAKSGDHLPGGDDAALDREDRIVLAVWQKHRADGFSHGRGNLRNRMTISLDIERLHHPRVFRHICHTDLEAAAIAVQHGWIVDPQPQREHTPDELEAITAFVRTTLAAIANAKRAGPLYHEPSPPEPVVEFRHPGPRHATPEQLDRLNPLPGGRKRHAISTTAAASRLAGQEGSDTTTSANDDDHPPEAA
jgi:hypothetical protein